MVTAIVLAFMTVVGLGVGYQVGRDEERRRAAVRAAMPKPLAKCAPPPAEAPIVAEERPAGLPLFLAARPAGVRPRPAVVARGVVLPNGLFGHHQDDVVEFRRFCHRINSPGGAE